MGLQFLFSMSGNQEPYAEVGTGLDLAVSIPVLAATLRIYQMGVKRRL